MKKTIRFLTITMAVVLIVLAFPMSALAKTLMAPTLGFDTETDYYVIDPANTLLLDIDNLADTTNAAPGEATYTTEGAVIYNNRSNADGDYIRVSEAASGAWNGFIGHTNLPLETDSVYAISYRAQYTGAISGKYLMGGFQFSAESSIWNAYGVYFSIGEYNTTMAYLSPGGEWAENVPAANRFPVNIDIFEEHDYIITINGMQVGFYVDGAFIGNMTLPANYFGLGDGLDLGWELRCDVASGGTIAKVTNIKVYNGGVVSSKVNTLLLDIDNLADTTNAAPGTATYTNESPLTRTGDEVVNGNVVSASSTDWPTYVGHTNIPLADDSVYTISYRMKVTATPVGSNLIGGFVFADAGSVWKTSCIYFGQGEYPGTTAYLCTGGLWTSESEEANRYTVDVDITEAHDYIIAINGLSVGFYIDNVFIGNMTLKAGYGGTNGCIALGAQFRANGNLAEISNIKVYSGLPQYSPNPNYQDGDVLVRVPDVIEATGWTSDFEDLTVSQVADGFQNAKKGEMADAIYPADHYDSASDDLYKGVTTNLPLNENTKYTVEFYMKKYQAANIGFCVTAGSWRYSQGVYFYNHSFTTIAQYSSNYYSDAISFENIWTAYADNDGYTRFTIEINGYQWKVYIGGVEAGTFNINTNGKHNETYQNYSNTLGLALKIKSDEIDTWNLADPVVSLKNVTVYAGNVATNKSIQFVKDGIVLDHQYQQANNVIDAFPAIAVGENETAVWFYKGTNVVVTAPYTVHHDATLEARVVDKSLSKVAGMQNTEAAENAQSVRFIATIHSLEASAAGFEINAKYLEETVLKEKNWDALTSYVYSTINATENGTVKTVSAGELGGTYLFVISVDDVPTNIGQIDFYVRSYVVVNGEKVYSEVASFTLNNGVFTTELPKLS